MAPDGYAWWYVDGISHDQRRAISVIAFIGSVFSPWYRWSGRKEPENHICLNVATYGPGGRFAMTDRGQSALGQSAHTLLIGPSSLCWTRGQLVINIDEYGAPPLFGRLRGRVTLTPRSVTDRELALTEDGAHVWRPFAPACDIEVDLRAPGWQWSGHGYFDANFGTRALEADFDYWTWGRFPVKGGVACFYDALRRDGTCLEQAVLVDENGKLDHFAAPARAKMARSGWMVARDTRADPGHRPRQVMGMLDAPFYTRAMVETRLNGERSVGVHEALDLRRFRKSWLMPMLACRVPRRSRWVAPAEPEDRE